MPSGCARTPTSSIFTTTFRSQTHFQFSTGGSRAATSSRRLMTARPRTWAAMRVIEHDLRQDRADEFMKVGHWDTWEDDGVVQDKTTGLFAIQEKVHRVDHQGGYFRSFSGGAAALKQHLQI
jgi:hypothetical protein